MPFAAERRYEDDAHEVLFGCRVILFDLDDTLLRSRMIKWQQYKSVACRQYGIALTEEELTRQWGKPFDEMISALYRRSAPLEEMRAATLALEPQYPKTPIDGAVRTVERLLDLGFGAGVVTATNTSHANFDLERTGFPVERLLFVHGADLTLAHKPDPEVFRLALDRLADDGITAADMTYVGDSLTDAEAARRAGLRFVGVTTGLVGRDEFTRVGARSVPTLSHLLGQQVTDS